MFYYFFGSTYELTFVENVCVLSTAVKFGKKIFKKRNPFLELFLISRILLLEKKTLRRKISQIKLSINKD